MEFHGKPSTKKKENKGGIESLELFFLILLNILG